MQDPAAGAAVEPEAVAAEPPPVATLRQGEVGFSADWPGLSVVILPGMFVGCIHCPKVLPSMRSVQAAPDSSRHHHFQQTTVAPQHHAAGAGLFQLGELAAAPQLHHHTPVLVHVCLAPLWAAHVLYKGCTSRSTLASCKCPVQQAAVAKLHAAGANAVPFWARKVQLHSGLTTPPPARAVLQCVDAD